MCSPLFGLVHSVQISSCPLFCFVYPAILQWNKFTLNVSLTLCSAHRTCMCALHEKVSIKINLLIYFHFHLEKFYCTAQTKCASCERRQIAFNLFSQSSEKQKTCQTINNVYDIWTPNDFNSLVWQAQNREQSSAQDTPRNVIKIIVICLFLFAPIHFRLFSIGVGTLFGVDAARCVILYGQHNALVHHIDRSIFIVALSDAFRPK